MISLKPSHDKKHCWQHQDFLKRKIIFSKLDPSTVTLSNKIGKGGYSEVFRGHYGKIEVAVKRSKPITSKKFFKSLQDEVSNITYINQLLCTEYIPIYYGYYDTTSRRWGRPSPVRSPGWIIDKHVDIVMELISGGDLFSYTKKRGVIKMKPPQLETHLHKMLPVLISVSKGFSCFHDSGIVHMDVKPQNIMLTKDLVPKIIDYGFICTSNPEYSPCSEKKGSGGTPYYISPEVLHRTARYVDIDLLKKSDVYSLGCVFFYVLTGIPYKIGDTLKVVYKNTKDGTHQPLSMIVNQQMGELIEYMTNLNPEDRPDIHEVTAILETIDSMLT